jgi:Domain of unknown function (DUF1877)
MSMVCSLIQVDLETVKGLLANPEELLDFYEQHWANREAPITCNLGEADLYLYGFYYSLHMTFTEWECRNIWPYHFLQEGGSPIGDVEVGYCPGRAFSVQQLVEIAQMLEEIPESAVETLYAEDHQGMPGLQECLEALVELFRQLKAFVSRSAKMGKSVLLFIT